MKKKIESGKDQPIFPLIAELCLRLGEAPIKGKIWKHQVDDHWLIAVNGMDGDAETGPFGQSTASHTLKPYHCYVEFNGWPAGEFNPYDGWFAAGSCANTETFCEALQKKIDSLPRIQ